MSTTTQPIAIMAPIILTIISLDGLSENDFFAISFGAITIRMPMIPMMTTHAIIMNLYITLPPEEPFISILSYNNALVKNPRPYVSGSVL